jgi:hypothetical protein
VLTNQRVSQLLCRFDADKSGFISFAEFAVAGPSAQDVQEEAAVLQPQWDALSQVLAPCLYAPFSFVRIFLLIQATGSVVSSRASWQ